MTKRELDDISTWPQEPLAPLPPAHEHEDTPIDWERWLGIRGAAIVGGIALALAGLFFAQYAIRHGWFGPSARVTTGGLLGLALLLGRSQVERRTTPLVADVLAGAGAVMGYASAWSAWKVHGLIPLGFAFPWMTLVTALCCSVAGKQRSKVVALFGFGGGFATPLLLETWEGGPFDLFAYLLLLDLGLLALARARSWSWLVPLSIAGTALFQALWFAAEMGPGQGPIGLFVAGGFGLLFLLAARSMPDQEDERLEAITRHAGLALAGMFALSIAVRAELQVGIWSLGPYVLLLSAGAALLARLDRQPSLATVAAMSGITILFSWAGANDHTDAYLAQFAGAAVLLGLLWFLDARSAQTTEGRGPAHGGDWLLRPEAPLTMVTFAGIGGLILWTSEGLPEATLAPLAVGGLALLALQWFVVRGGAIPLASLALLFGLGLASIAVSGVSTPLVAHGVALLVAAAGLADRERGRFVAPAVLVPLMLFAPGEVDSFAGSVVLTAMTALAAWGTTRSRIQRARIQWSESVPVVAAAIGSIQLAYAGASLAWVLLPAVAAVAPLVRRPSREAAFVVAVAPFLWLHPFVSTLAETHLGRPGFLLLLALLPAACAWRCRPAAPALAAALTLFAFCLSFAIGVEPWAVGFVLTGFFAVALGRVANERWLLEAGAIAQVTGALPLLVLALIPARFASSSVPGLGAPLAAFGTVGALLLLGSAWTRERVHANALGTLGVLCGFAWLCLGVADAFHDGARIVMLVGRDEARDMTLSIVWALYALALLGLGTRFGRLGLRWLSLAFTILTIGKVFLFDLGELHGLYRVASMTGLAISLLLVSLLYQRVVFRKPELEAAPSEA